VKRRKWVVVAFGLVLLAIGAGVALLAADPVRRARFHLLHASPAEVRLDPEQRSEISGHALSFLQSGDAREALQAELLGLAREEALRDDAVCYRGLVFEVVMGSESRLAMRRTKKIPFPLPASGLAMLVGCLKSRDLTFRAWMLARLPLDVRVLEAVALEHLAASAPDVGEESRRRATKDWLLELLVEHHRMFEDSKWQPIIFHEKTDPRGLRALGLSDASIAKNLVAWIEENRAKMPEQVR
jgi:hypothetical protein